MINKESVILVTGANGLVGSSLVAYLKNTGHRNVHALTRKDADLRSFEETRDIFKKLNPEFVFHIAAKVYGIWGNLTNKGLSFYENIRINTNVIEACRIVGVKKICAMGSGAVYPANLISKPLIESNILMGEPHFAEDSYAHAKRAMLAMLKAYQESYHLNWAFVVSGNLYGPGDKFDTVNGHVIPSLIKKFYNKAERGVDLVVWGDGSSKRDFMYSEDAAAALYEIMKHIDGSINLGSGQISSIADVVNELCLLTSIDISDVIWDKDKPNGQDYRAYDLQKLNALGFKSQNSLRDGLNKTWKWYKNIEKR